MPLAPCPQPTVPPAFTPSRVTLPEALALARRLDEPLARDHALPRDRWRDTTEHALRRGDLERCAALLHAELPAAVAEAVIELAAVVVRVMIPPAALDPAWELEVIERLELLALLVSHARSVVELAAQWAAREDRHAREPLPSPRALDVLAQPCAAPDGTEPDAFVAATLALALAALVEPAHAVLRPSHEHPHLALEPLRELEVALSRAYGALAGALLHHLGAPATGAWLLAAPTRIAVGW